MVTSLQDAIADAYASRPDKQPMGVLTARDLNHIADAVQKWYERYNKEYPRVYVSTKSAGY